MALEGFKELLVSKEVILVVPLFLEGSKVKLIHTGQAEDPAMKTWLKHSFIN